VLRSAIRWIRAIAGRTRLEREMAEELRFHLESRPPISCVRASPPTMPFAVRGWSSAESKDGRKPAERLAVFSVVNGGPVLANVVYQAAPRDPQVLIMAALTLGLMAIVACWSPVRRAFRIDPAAALRSE
jgi:hypothetical protein